MALFASASICPGLLPGTLPGAGRWLFPWRWLSPWIPSLTARKQISPTTKFYLRVSSLQGGPRLPRLRHPLRLHLFRLLTGTWQTSGLRTVTAAPLADPSQPKQKRLLSLLAEGCMLRDSGFGARSLILILILGAAEENRSGLMAQNNLQPPPR